MKDKKGKILILVSLVGLILSFLLLVVDFNSVNQVSNGICNISSYINCDKIAASSFSHIGPVPVSAIGIFFYFFIALYGVFAKDSENFLRISALLFLLASVGSLLLFAISIFHIKALCIFCTGTYIVNWVGLYLLKSHLKFDFSGLFTKSSISSLAIGAGLAIAMTLGGYFIVKDSIKALPQKGIIADYNKSDTYNVNTMYSPYKGSNNPKIEIVVYANFFCGHCLSFSSTLDRILAQDKYAKNIRVYHKVYLNERYYTGNAAPVVLSNLFYELMAEGKSLELEHRWRTDPARSSAKKGIRLAEDILGKKLDMKKVREANLQYGIAVSREGRALGINGTPTWFINGKKIPGAYPYSQVVKLLDYLLEKK